MDWNRDVFYPGGGKGGGGHQVTELRFTTAPSTLLKRELKMGRIESEQKKNSTHSGSEEEIHL